MSSMTINRPFILFVILFTGQLHSCRQEKSSDIPDRIAQVSSQKELLEMSNLVDSLIHLHQPQPAGLWLGLLGKKAAELHRYRDAERYFIKAIKEDPAFEGTSQHLFELAEIYRGYLDKSELANTIYCSLSEKAPAGLKEKAGKACQLERPGIDSLMVVWNANAMDDKTGRLDPVSAQDFIAAAQVRALLYPEETISAMGLFEAAQWAKALRSFPMALQLYDWVLEDYSEGPFGPKSLFLRAFTLENDLGNLEAAKADYEAFLKRWPDDPFADDARLLLENLGKDPGELIRQFESQSGTQ